VNKIITPFITFSLILLFCVSCLARLTTTRIPIEAVEDIPSARTEVVWSLDWKHWAPDLPEKTEIHIFKAELVDNTIEQRAFLRVNGVNYYLGRLASQFKQAPIDTLTLEYQGERIIIGCVDGTLTGTLTFINITRVESNPAKFSEATKTAEIKNRCFFFPIFSQERSAWEEVSRIGIKTRESSDRAMEEKSMNFYTSETAYEPSVNIASFFIIIKP
jgi:hypothetical protein